MSPRVEHLTVDGPRGPLEVETGGPEDGRLLVSHHGTPGSGRLFGPHITSGADRGLRHAAYSRPGYAGSARHPGRSVADAAADTAAIADALGAERFFTLGASGGGPHALACAALLPDRVIAAATIAGVAPHRAEGLDWSDGMGDENVAEFGAAEAGEDVLRAFLDHARPELLHITGTTVAEALGGLLSDVDRRALTGAFADYLARETRAGLQPGVDGWLDDDLAFVRGDGWGFPLRFTPPVSIWQGGQDRMVPLAHGEWLADNADGVTAHLLPDEGHLSLDLDRYEAILDDLLAATRT